MIPNPNRAYGLMIYKLLSRSMGGIHDMEEVRDNLVRLALELRGTKVLIEVIYPWSC